MEAAGSSFVLTAAQATSPMKPEPNPPQSVMEHFMGTMHGKEQIFNKNWQEIARVQDTILHQIWITTA